ncbi:hypothetical protein ACIHFC_18365 [Streptomyces sp. NPDC052013]|uniref:hypothetical protein n=1 Tax=Streptomyces sp. NPDC052013 TaxID=3365679 RepID=UPI0037D3AA08
MTLLPSPSRASYLRLVRASAWYDLVVTAGFATPWSYALVHSLLSSAGDALGLGVLPDRDPMQTLYANLMGSVVVVWAVLRLTRTLPAYGVYDGAARTLFSAWLAYGLTTGAPALLWPFLAVEITLGAIQLAPWWRRTRRDDAVEAVAGIEPA